MRLAKAPSWNSRAFVLSSNEAGDGDSGPNNLQNFPLLTAATSDGTSETTIDGTLDSTADTTFDLDYYASAACDASGNGEGALYLGSDQVTTDANGDVAFSSVLAVGVADGQFVTATASSPDGSTSELSGCAEVGAQAMEDQVYDWHYDYDPLGRVTDACSDWDEVGQTCLGDAFSFEYDGAGNVTTFSRWDEAVGQVETVRYVYNTANQIACHDGDANLLCGDPGDTDYLYDTYGNLTDDGANTYVYDAANRLVSVSDGVSTSSFVYNGDGDRVAQTVDGVETTYLLDVATPLTMVLAETTGADTIHYFHALGLVAESDGTDTDYFATDGLGSVRQLTDDAADVLLAQTFDPYGNPYASAGAGGSAFGFTGEYSDPSGLLYLRARYYNPAQGRFLQMDPSRREQNPYLYGLGNPINHVDPSGEVGCLVFEPPEVCLERLSRTIDSLKSIADPTRNPRTAAFHNSFWEGVDAWTETIFPTLGETLEYTVSAASEGRWQDAERGVQGLDQETALLRSAIEETKSQIGWGLVTTPVRIVTTDIPEFFNSVHERLCGQDRFWDVLFTGSNLAADVTVVYGGYSVARAGVGSVRASINASVDRAFPSFSPESYGPWGPVEVGAYRGVGLSEAIPPRYVAAPRSKWQSVLSQHGSDWGWSQSSGTIPQTNANLQILETRIRAHVENPNVEQIVGTYRNTQSGIHYYDPISDLWVFTEPDGTFLTAWRLDLDQIQNLYRSGNVQ